LYIGTVFIISVVNKFLIPKAMKTIFENKGLVVRLKNKIRSNNYQIMKSTYYPIMLLLLAFSLQGCYVSRPVPYAYPTPAPQPEVVQEVAPPQWAPVYDNPRQVQYYYLPDLEVYYDVWNHEFVYLDGGNWIFEPSLPPMYGNYDLYDGHVVILDYNVHQPWMHHELYVSHYPRYYYHSAYPGENGGGYASGYNENTRKPYYGARNNSSSNNTNGGRTNSSPNPNGSRTNSGGTHNGPQETNGGRNGNDNGGSHNVPQQTNGGRNGNDSGSHNGSQQTNGGRTNSTPNETHPTSTGQRETTTPQKTQPIHYQEKTVGTPVKVQKNMQRPAPAPTTTKSAPQAKPAPTQTKPANGREGGR
jgi:hypothetical protein